MYLCCHQVRHNFRLDESGIRHQLKILAGVIERLDDQTLGHHIQKIGSGDMMFAYRMVVVQLRRELQTEQASAGSWGVCKGVS